MVYCSNHYFERNKQIADNNLRKCANAFAMYKILITDSSSVPFFEQNLMKFYFNFQNIFVRSDLGTALYLNFRVKI